MLNLVAQNYPILESCPPQVCVKIIIHYFFLNYSAFFLLNLQALLSNDTKLRFIYFSIYFSIYILGQRFQLSSYRYKYLRC